MVLVPVLFSFGVGLVYMLKTGDVSTAWTISSYVVTAAGGKILPFMNTGGLRANLGSSAVVALLAILGSLKER